MKKKTIINDDDDCEWYSNVLKRWKKKSEKEWQKNKKTRWDEMREVKKIE